MRSLIEFELYVFGGINAHLFLAVGHLVPYMTCTDQHEKTANSIFSWKYLLASIFICLLLQISLSRPFLNI